MMSDRQYRTLREGDRRLPGYECRLRYVPHAQWVPSDAVGIIDADDIRHAEYRVPCSATVAPDGYEVVDPARLPEDARVGATWLRREPEDDRWSGMRGGWGWVMDTTPRRIVYAAPADELAALYAAGDAEREQPAPVGDGWRLLGDDELIAHGDETSEGGAPWKEIAAFEYHRAAGVFGAHNRYRRRVEPQPVEQPATAPASPCPCCAERDRLAAEVERLLGCVDASRRRADRAEASLAATTKAYDAALAEVGRLKEKSEALVQHFVAMLCQDCSAHAGDRCPSPTEIMDALKGRCHMCDAAEVERLRGEYSSTVHSYARRIAAARAALEGRDV